MPAMADIVVKKDDGVTNITYTAISRSGGDLSPALWREQSLTTMRGGQPNVQLKAYWNGAKDGRRTDFYGVYPWLITDSTTTVQSIRSKMILSASLIVPQEIPVTYANEGVAQLVNMVAGLKFGWQGGFSYT